MTDLYKDLNARELEVIQTAEHKAGNKLIGRFGLKGQSTWFHLLELSEFDKSLVEGIQVKDGECIFRYITVNSAAGGMCTLIKINFERRLIYFLTQDASERGYVEFEPRAEKAPWIILGKETRKET
jgi:hypothetical protein